MAYLHSKGVIEQHDLDKIGGDHREALLSRIGMTSREGSSDGRRLLGHAIRKFMNGDNGGGQRERPASAFPDISRYTTLLKEYADHNKVVLEYTPETVSVEPPSYKSRVTLKGVAGDVTGEGTGRTKKEARHLASKRLYQRLGLPVS